jgi:hypothetical protein
MRQDRKAEERTSRWRERELAPFLSIDEEKQKSEKNEKLSTSPAKKRNFDFFSAMALRLSGRFLASALRSSSAASQAQGTTTTAASAVSKAGRRAFSSIEGTFGDKERAEEVRFFFRENAHRFVDRRRRSSSNAALVLPSLVPSRTRPSAPGSR